MNHRPLCLAVGALSMILIAVACDKKSEEPAPAQPPVAASPTPQPSKVEVVSSAAPAPAPMASPAPVNPALLKPEAAKDKAPDKFKVKFTTTKGDFVVEVNRAWAPLGADRIYNLVKLGFFNDAGFFRVVPNFVVQFGIHGNPQVSSAWRGANIKDDPVSKQSNEKGTLTFAKGGADSRTTQIFVNYKDNARLDKMGFPPFGKVVQGMDVVEKINQEYGEQPQQPTLQSEGNAYLQREFPRLDYVRSATIVK
jgi:peptidyl-prolyl cis-trans isomerase A (cyclophilin A)